MRQVLKPGEELDFLVREELQEVAEELLSGYLRPPDPIRPQNGEVTDASGDAVIELYRVVTGYQALITRLVVEVSGYNPTSTPPAGYAYLLRSNELIDFVDFADGVPAVGTWNESNAPRFYSTERVILQVYGAPADTAIVCRAQGFLLPQPELLV